ncbi:MAG TPA: DUF2231 domain-containing protein [Pilimelia sp.]|nr:DUF2231 domain-containing protein [Pilimelia sp.]
MFDEITGIPAHPLVVHAAVVFVPLLCLAAVAYGALPRVRGALGWVAATLAVVAPLSAWFATLSGEELERRLVERNYPPEVLAQVERHAELGTVALYLTLPLALVTLALVGVCTVAPRRGRPAPRWLTVLLTLAAAGLAAAAAYYTVRTGDTGARAVWGNL